MIKEIFSTLSLAGLMLTSQASYANTTGPLSIDTQAGKPLWELGVFSAGFRGPMYPAAKDSQNKFIPVPLVIYRGKTIRLGDDSFVKAIAVEKERFKLDVSLSGAFNADSEDSRVREGMPDLDFMFEIGPEASFLLTDNLFLEHSHELWLKLPLRSVFSTDFSAVDHQGYVFQPELAFTVDDLFAEQSRFFASVAPIFTTDKTQAYFYDVELPYVTAERAFYQSKGGYLGTELSIANSIELNNEWMLFTAAQIGFWQGAKNASSPLHQQNVTYSIALGVKWTWLVSEERVR
ncbi:MipA/OmpV family protein [Thalassotalea maritima]|uniref:MipA/OmpV family protein n=1 Tax=Thalassotalea maritima TaxID=3242416 RepID=UPI0035281F04